MSLAAKPRAAPVPRAARVMVVLAGLALALILGSAGHDRLREGALQNLAERGEGTKHLAVAALQGQLRRFDRLPGLIAQQAVILDLLYAPRNPDRVLSANLYLRATNDLLQSSDIYVMGLDGTTIAASNFDTPVSFMGGNFAFRPYFRDVFTQGAGRFYALGTTSLVRGYYFGAPILIDDTIAAVMVIKIDLDSIEQSWRGSDYEVIVTDPEGIIFMSSHPEWTYTATRPLTDERLARTQATRRYANETLSELPLTAASTVSGRRLWQIGGEEYMVLSSPMPEADWTVHVLIGTASARALALTQVLVGGMLAGLAAMAGVVIWQRRLRLRERLAIQAGARAQLEARVEARTAELAAVNRQLEAEVSERRATEARLRNTQTELVQAGKLAALGQMSAALSHEFNQPLGAAQNLAENAQLLIERNRVPEARENITRILALIARMGSISRHLRNFARSPNQKLVDVPISEPLAAAQEIIGWRLREAGVQLSVDLGDPAPLVRAGPVRLQQVIVNILSNALDAMEDSDTRAISITARIEGPQAVLTFADTGPGFAPGLVERIFDPFFSTKGVGKGLGLGLSISYNIVHDFGGTLAAANGADGGAVFTLTLPLAEAAARQAA